LQALERIAFVIDHSPLPIREAFQGDLRKGFLKSAEKILLAHEKRVRGRLLKRMTDFLDAYHVVFKDHKGVVTQLLEDWKGNPPEGILALYSPVQVRKARQAYNIDHESEDDKKWKAIRKLVREDEYWVDDIAEDTNITPDEIIRIVESKKNTGAEVHKDKGRYRIRIPDPRERKGRSARLEEVPYPDR
jgi:hypothetical protein